MANKVTMRDIAKECNVSVATVSYVLNHSDKEKISSDTYLKVTETATRLHYSPSHSYENHIGRKSSLVGIVINIKKDNTQSKKTIFLDLAAELSAKLKADNFDSVLLITDNLKRDFPSMSKRGFDAVFMIDIDNENLSSVTSKYNVPIIFIHCDVDDELFCKIIPNYAEIFEKSKEMLNTNCPALIMEDIYCQNLKCKFYDYFLPVDIFINSPHSNLPMFLESHKNNKKIIVGDILAAKVFKYVNPKECVVVSFLHDCDILPENVNKISISNKKVAEIAVKTLDDMINFTYNSKEENRIMINY